MTDDAAHYSTCIYCGFVWTRCKRLSTVTMKSCPPWFKLTLQLQFAVFSTSNNILAAFSTPLSVLALQLFWHLHTMWQFNNFHWLHFNWHKTPFSAMTFKMFSSLCLWLLQRFNCFQLFDQLKFRQFSVLAYQLALHLLSVLSSQLTFWLLSSQHFKWEFKICWLLHFNWHFNCSVLTLQLLSVLMSCSRYNDDRAISCVCDVVLCVRWWCGSMEEVSQWVRHLSMMALH